MPEPRPDAERPPATPASADERRALISALVDGEASSLAAGCAAWRSDAGARADWHAYHLIGDVMRSDELASRPGRDAAFLAGLRVRLEAEPPVLAPAPVAAASGLVRARRRQRWLFPAAAAAGFVAVAGVLVVSRVAAPGAGDEGTWLAGARAPMGAQTVGVTLGPAPAPAGAVIGGAVGGAVGGAAPAMPAQMLVVEGRLIRDPQLDAYLEAHRRAGLGASVAVPGGAPRNFADAPVRVVGAQPVHAAPVSAAR